MKKSIYLFVLCIVCLSCRREFEAPLPDLTWNLFSTASKLPAPVYQRLDGVYAIEEGAEAFGAFAAAKWSYTANGRDTTYHLSFFCERSAAYFVCEGRRLDNSILLDGYWRRMVNTETGRIRLTISKDSGAAKLLGTNLFLPGESIRISGVYGIGNAVPDAGIRLRYSKPLFTVTPFQILAHRGGGRTADLLPASENSIEIIRMASRFGATGVEIDVRLTKDGIPVLFHDATLNERVVQKSGLLGPIENYTFDQLSTLVRLTNGERIPTLRQALETIIAQTPLQFVWLDTKFNGAMQVLRDLQAEYQQKAEAMNRKLEITIGIPDKDVLTNFKMLPNHQSIPSIVEFSPEEASNVNARIWAPQWTLGLQKEEVSKQQLQGRRVFTWTMDIEENIAQYLLEGTFNGILTNYPSVVAYHYYVRQ